MDMSELKKGDRPLENYTEVVQLRAKVSALEQLLEVYEQETVEKSSRLEQTLADLHSHTQKLSHAESTLATLRSMLNSIGDAVMVVDQAGKFLFLNPSAESLLGISNANSSLQNWAQGWDVYLPDQTTLHSLETFPVLRAIQGEDIDAMEVYVCSSQCAEGNWFSVTAQPLRNQEDVVQGGIAVFHNITHRKRVELALRESETHSREQAQQLQQAFYDLQHVQTQLVQTEKMSSLGQLVAGIAHEINNPVNFVYGNLKPARNYLHDLINLIGLYQSCYPTPHPLIQEEMEEMDLDFVVEDLPKLLDSMKVGAERIQGIVSSLRNFCRMDEAEMKLVNIHDGLESTLMILRNRLKAKPESVEIEVIRQYGDLPLVECYTGQLNQVFMNILSNAIDALEEARNRRTPQDESPCITIQTKVICNRQIDIYIRDNGPGVPEAARTKLFAPFFTTKPLGKGTGMGLSISHQIVTEKHQGHLMCESEVGKGTTFIITIPAKHTQA